MLWGSAQSGYFYTLATFLRYTPRAWVHSKDVESYRTRRLEVAATCAKPASAG